MKTIESKTEKKIICDIGKYRHVVTYTATDTDPSAVRIESLADDIYMLVAPDVSGQPMGTMRLDGAQITAVSMAVCPELGTIAEDVKAIISALQAGHDIVERPFEESIE